MYEYMYIYIHVVIRLKTKNDTINIMNSLSESNTNYYGSQ